MCELCDLREQAEKKRELYNFRIVQMQIELKEGQEAAAMRAKGLAVEAFMECLDLVEQHSREVKKDRDCEELPKSVAEILAGGKLN